MFLIIFKTVSVYSDDSSMQGYERIVTIRIMIINVRCTMLESSRGLSWANLIILTEQGEVERIVNVQGHTEHGDGYISFK